MLTWSQSFYFLSIILVRFSLYYENSFANDQKRSSYDIYVYFNKKKKLYEEKVEEEYKNIIYKLRL